MFFMKVRGIAHRGYPTKYPENTLISFQAACDLSFSEVELDAHLSKDGIPVVMHDRTINRMCNGKGWIKNYTLQELKKFRVGEIETVPTLEEALQLLKGKVKVNLELKQMGNFYPGLEQSVLDVIQKGDMIEQVYINSFDHFSIAKVRELSPDVEIGLILSGSAPYVFPFMKEINANYLAVKLPYITRTYAELCEKHNVQLIAWPVDSENEMKYIIENYPSALICTNFPERWLSVSGQ
jgi:glycerophosphoryl diester phosphodiesterase